MNAVLHGDDEVGLKDYKRLSCCLLLQERKKTTRGPENPPNVAVNVNGDRGGNPELSHTCFTVFLFVGVNYEV